MTIDYIRKRGCIVLECISGSKSYGLELPGSDTDIKGVFVLPKEDFFGMNRVDQVSNDTNDITFYELGRFIELLAKNNPNLLELLATPEEFVLYRNPVMSELRPETFLSRLCKSSFANYAWSQVKKAKSLNKKIFNPIDERRKTILDFCHVLIDNQSKSLENWLIERGWQAERCGLAAIDHVRDVYAIYYDVSGNLNYQGIVRKENSNDVSLSSIPKGEKLFAYFHFNKDGYSSYCKKYKEYWEWVEKRNDIRYQNTLEHGKNYDAKNMMHVFRLLDMAEEIALGKGIITKRPNREYLLSIRSGQYQYEQLLHEATLKIEKVKLLFSNSNLPEKPDEKIIKKLLVRLREKFYQS